MNNLQASINGQVINIHAGETILQAAKRLNISIPTLCYGEGLRPEGGCRLCLVEVNHRDKPVAACHTPILAGMEIQTHTPKLEELRRDILSLYLESDFQDQSLSRIESDESENMLHHPQSHKFNQLLHDYHLPSFPLGDRHSAATSSKIIPKIDDSHPYLRFDVNRCITCRLCLNTCEQIQGQFVYGIANRGGASQLIFGAGINFAESPCVSCGACVERCPTGAISDRDRLAAPPIESVTETVCGYCGVGCRLEVSTAQVKNTQTQNTQTQVVQISGVSDAAVNHGHLCVKGRYAHAYHHSPDRLTQPLKRVGQEFQPISWQEAIALIASKLLQIKAESGQDALGAFTSSRSTNEAAYLLQKLFRSIIGTNNVDCCARVCHSSTAMALQIVTGTGAATASYEDIEKAKCIVIAGANPTEGHPIVGARIKQAVLNGAKLVIIDPRHIELADYADVHLQLLSATNVPLFNAIAKIIIAENLIDQDYLRERVEGFDEFCNFVQNLALDEVAAITSVAPELIRKAAQIIGDAGTALFVSGLGLSELTQGVSSVITYCNLGMLTGSIGQSGAGMLPLRGQNNVQGNADMGGMPNQFTGYQPLNSPEVRNHLAKLWGSLPSETAGLTIPEMLDGAATGKIRALWVQGEDIAQSDPNEHHVRAALANLDFLVVQELFLSETAKYAHVVLPAAAFLEQEGTFTNGERRIQHVRPAVAPPFDARPDWMAIRDIAIAMGANWQYATPSAVMEEIAKVAPHLFGGVSYSRLTNDGLQWPCSTADHQGTSTVHKQGFIRGKGKLVSIDYIPSPEHGIADYPFLLITGRVLEHYNVGTMTRRTPNQVLVSEDLLEIHPFDAHQQGISDRQPVKIQSRWGEIVVKAKLSRKMALGTLFLTFHYPETHTNFLTGPHLDPQSRCPQYKAIAVRLQTELNLEKQLEVTYG
ncbi:formate dehydrogenase subunit alpha [Pseudanabaena yagii]|uniref:Formate dehydrogenase subunit alpha n=1 Tax=Pseudanabaena yagii GIHE-NHR1 TaxID=2722753 RepID=A0ABX1LSR9_9CYAN|nr:formate dehydrogenase subunit alpha [Pseudanabaena yagii]NMF58381.1 formate dehydrogenase subunit alpha [Pseudanabaena yagii GIHE-NHR1]